VPLALGDPAPDFTLRSSDDRDVALAAVCATSNVVLIFYPKDQTPGCTKQLCTARDDRAAYEAAGVAVFGVNGDSADSHRRFIAKHGLTMPLLIDPGLAVAQRYDAVIGLGPVKFVNRTVVGIDRQGRVAFYERGMPATERVLAAFAPSA
jgi:peroxiredoxin Q/BCP